MPPISPLSFQKMTSFQYLLWNGGFNYFLITWNSKSGFFKETKREREIKKELNYDLLPNKLLFAYKQ